MPLFQIYEYANFIVIMYIVVCLPAVSINEETETPETDLTKKSPLPISSTVNDPSLMAALKLNVIVLAAVFAPPLPVIIRVGLIPSSTKLPLEPQT
jgi:hypothetical protein